MGSLSFISVLLKGLRSARLHSGQRTARVLTYKVGDNFFDAASPHCRPQPMRAAIRKGSPAPMACPKPQRSE
jgi:hypothetical protein